MSLPRWIIPLLRRLAPEDRAEDLLGDLEEVHRERVVRRGRRVACLLTGVEAIEMALSLRRLRTLDRISKRTTRGVVQRVLARGPAVSWLDFKLGFRMLRRYPGLTIVGGLAMAFGIAIGAGTYQLARVMVLPHVPYADGDRIVTIQMRDPVTARTAPQTWREFVRLRESLEAVEDLTARALSQRNLSMDGRGTAPASVVAISPSAFRMIGMPPFLGRSLVAEDEAMAAEPVAVLSHELWQRRFGADPGVVGRVVRLGGKPTTIVGVMPGGLVFTVPPAFPTIDRAQDLWVPLRPEAGADGADGGPAVEIFGRLRPGVTSDQIQGELHALALTDVADESGGGPAPTWEVLTFGHPAGLSDWPLTSGLFTLNGLFFAALMALLCGNVALLLFARAATRESEIAVRSALGASRARIVAQLFAEALALAAVAITLGLAGAAAEVRWAVRTLTAVEAADGIALPPWIGDTLSSSTIAYAAVLAVVGAVVAGVLPGLRVTARNGAPAQRIGGGASGARMGRLWTVVIVAQVAVATAFVPIALILGHQTWRARTMDFGLPASEYLSVRLEMDGDGVAPASRFTEDVSELERRLRATPGVRGVTVASKLPGAWHLRRVIELDTPDRSTFTPQITSVAPGFFEIMNAPVIAGRGFTPADVVADRDVVVVNESFVREYLGGRNAVGLRLRFSARSAERPEEAWLEIAGVVRDLLMTADPTRPHNAGIYLPARPGEMYPLSMAIHVTGEPEAFVPRVRELADAIDPLLRVHQPGALDESASGMLRAFDGWFKIIALVSVVTLLLTNAGIYAVVSFTVARRTREIGLRIALGAERRWIVTAVLARTARYVSIGSVIGMLIGLAFVLGIAEGSWNPSLTVPEVGLLGLAYVFAMAAICMLASTLPTRRALTIEPTQALRVDG